MSPACHTDVIHLRYDSHVNRLTHLLPDEYAMNANILIVEDEPDILNLIANSLTREDFSVTQTTDVAQAKRALLKGDIDLAVVDWMLPDVSGLECVRSIRQDEVTQHLPVIMLTARSDENDITTGLDAGADDYMLKPFSPRVLVSRVRALLRRSNDFNETGVLTQGGISLNTEQHHVAVGGKTITIGHTEFKLLHFLMRNPMRVYSRAQLLDHVWGRDTFIEERTIDVHVLRLRKHLKNHDAAMMIETVRGAGYRFNPDAMQDT